MADGYVIDTNLYIRALRDSEALVLLKRFLTKARARVWIHAVVAMELRAGATTAPHRDAVDALITPFSDRDRVVVPSYVAYEQAGRVLADLSLREGRNLAIAASSLPGDVLIATGCREAGVRLVTDNHRDFAAIARHLRGFRGDTPWPLS